MFHIIPEPVEIRTDSSKPVRLSCINMLLPFGLSGEDTIGSPFAYALTIKRLKKKPMGENEQNQSKGTINIPLCRITATQRGTVRLLCSSAGK